jgi:hypothetical protein
MSGLIPARRPAWDGVWAPDIPAFQFAVPSDIEAWLTEKVLTRFSQGNGHIVGALTARPERTGHYLIRLNGKEHVCHVKDVAGGDDLSVAASIADHLEQCGLAATRYQHDHSGAWETSVSGLSITLTTYCHGRHCNGSRADADALGEALGEMHASLRVFPQAALVERRSASNVAQLTTARDEALATALPSIPDEYRALVQSAAKRYDPSFDFGAQSQCLHGDITPGNVIFDADGKVFFCDFEDAAFTFHDRLFDIASAVLRFCIASPAPTDESSAEGRRQGFFDAYGNSGENVPAAHLVDQAMSNLVDHNVMVMWALTREGYLSSETEWSKFEHLRERADAQIAL